MSDETAIARWKRPGSNFRLSDRKYEWAPDFPPFLCPLTLTSLRFYIAKYNVTLQKMFLFLPRPTLSSAASCILSAPLHPGSPSLHPGSPPLHRDSRPSTPGFPPLYTRVSAPVHPGSPPLHPGSPPLHRGFRPSTPENSQNCIKQPSSVTGQFQKSEKFLPCLIQSKFYLYNVITSYKVSTSSFYCFTRIITGPSRKETVQRCMT